MIRDTLLQVNRPIFHLIFYLSGILILIGAHKIAPTNLAGPGLDLLVLTILLISSFAIAIKTFSTKHISIRNKIAIGVIHIFGLTFIYWWLILPG